MPQLVRDGLFIGNIEDAANVLDGADGGGPIFTHVLSVLSSASISFFSDWRAGLSIPIAETETVHVPADESPKRALAAGKVLYSIQRAGRGLHITRMAVPVRDTEEENLLDFLDVCLDFIVRGRKEGCVLVHCFAGVSRSAAVMTAYLMRTEKKTMEDALESLKQNCPTVCPNDGFLDQLQLFSEMGCVVNTSSAVYKRFRLKILGHSYQIGEKVDEAIFESDPADFPPSISSEDVSSCETAKTVYRCTKCRRAVASQSNLVSHIPGEGESCFGYEKRRSMHSYGFPKDQACTSLFIEPLKWMTSVVEGALQGKLSCIHCDARLGSFNWSGIQCSCGSWITPAFQIHKSKVDVSTRSLHLPQMPPIS